MVRAKSEWLWVVHCLTLVVCGSVAEVVEKFKDAGGAELKWLRRAATRVNQDETLPWSVDPVLGGPINPAKWTHDHGHRSKRTAEDFARYATDWRVKQPKPLRKVEDQGNCGSCWAFASTHAANDNLNIANGQASESMPSWRKLSVQQLTECICEWDDIQEWNEGQKCSEVSYDKDLGIYDRELGCRGAWGFQGLQYIKSHGTCDEKCKRYMHRDHPCKDKCDAGLTPNFNLTISSWHIISMAGQKPRNVTAMMEAVMRGPITAVFRVYADFYAFVRKPIGNLPHIYVKGDNPNNEKPTLHAVEIVGFNYSRALNMPYWIVKNSWGLTLPTFAKGIDKGYFNIRADTDECEIESIEVLQVLAGQKSAGQNSFTMPAATAKTLPAPCGPVTLEAQNVMGETAAAEALAYMHAQALDSQMPGCYPNNYNEQYISGEKRTLNGSGIDFTFMVNYTSSVCPGFWNVYRGNVLADTKQIKHVFLKQFSKELSSSGENCTCPSSIPNSGSTIMTARKPSSHFLYQLAIVAVVLLAHVFP